MTTTAWSSHSALANPFARTSSQAKRRSRSGTGYILTIVRCTVNRFVGFSGKVHKDQYFEAIAAAVAGQLRRERLRRGLSMNAIAERGGLSQQMVSYVERGLRNPTLDTLLRLAHALEMELAELIAVAQKQNRKMR